MTAYRYWGLRIPESEEGVLGQVDIAELKLRDTPGGTNLALGKTTNTSNGNGSLAVNGNVNDYWTGLGTGPTGGHWILVDLGADYDIVEIEITVRNNFFRGGDPIECTLFWAASLFSTHDDYYSFPTQAAWSNGETRTLSVVDPGTAAEADASQMGLLGLVSQPADFAYSSQVGLMLTSASEESSTNYDVLTHQLGMYALVKGFPDRRDLRAWTFVQDDHTFYVLQLSDAATLVYDRLTQQWAQWRSSGYPYWRGADGVDWEGFNVACDHRSGRIFKIDPTGRLDLNTTTELDETPIVSTVTGMARGNRMRGIVPCFMAELVLSEGSPPSGVAEGDVGLRLRTSDDDGRNWLDHGTISGEGVGEDMIVRWYGLGVMQPPGRVFEITDTGYARRIDALDVEIGGQ